MEISKRADRIPPFYVMELLEKASMMELQGHRIVHMEVGEPGFETPGPIKAAAIEALSEGKTFYTHSLGIPELRQAISDSYAASCQAVIPPDRVIITNGSSGAFTLLFTALLEPGRTLALADPGYPCYRNIASLTDCTIEPVPVSADKNYEIPPDHFDAAAPPDVLIIANPSNPTGAVYRPESIASLHARLAPAGGALIVDEIYSGLTYDVQFASSACIADDIIIVSGFSKAYAMTGWRLGWMIVPADLVRPVQKLAQNLFIAPPSVSQWAALKAFDDTAELARMRSLYKQRRDFLVPRLRDLGFTIPRVPDGAFYIYAGIENFGMDSMIFVERALAEAKVAITPGYDFGAHGASSHVRFSYANTLENLKDGCDMLEAWLKKA